MSNIEKARIIKKHFIYYYHMDEQSYPYNPRAEAGMKKYRKLADELKAKIEAEGCGKHEYAHLKYSNKCTNEDKDWEYWRCPDCQAAIKELESVLR